MTTKQFCFCASHCASYTDPDAYASDLALSDIWGDALDADIPADRLAALRGIYAAVNRPVREIVAATGLSQAAFAERLCIPLRTVEDWCRGLRDCPVYVRLLIQQALGQYTLAWHEGPFCQDINYLLQYWAMPEQQQALIAFTDNTAEETVLPTLSVPGELTDEYSAIFSEVNTYVREQTVAFISGERSLDEFDAYLQTLKDLKVERMIEIYQLALDEFNVR